MGEGGSLSRSSSGFSRGFLQSHHTLESLGGGIYSSGRVGHAETTVAKAAKLFDDRR